MKIPFDKLEVGMLTDHGLIVRFGAAGTDPFWTDSAFISMFDPNDNYHGQSSRAVKAGEEFEILHEPGTEGYRELVQKVLHERVNAMMDAGNDIDLLRAYLRLKP